LQMNTRKHLVYGSIVLIWIVVPALEITFTVLATDIVDGTCTRLPAYMSAVSKKVIGISQWLVSYFLPLVAMVICYARIVHALRTKVSYNLDMLLILNIM